MAWYTLLPQEAETWVVRIFFFLGLMTIIPWAALLLFDLTLYLWRMLAWEIPVIGGRARGRRRPRAPSLIERPDGQRRKFGLMGHDNTHGDSAGELRRRTKGGE